MSDLSEVIVDLTDANTLFSSLLEHLETGERVREFTEKVVSLAGDYCKDELQELIQEREKLQSRIAALGGVLPDVRFFEPTSAFCRRRHRRQRNVVALAVIGRRLRRTTMRS